MFIFLCQNFGNPSWLWLQFVGSISIRFALLYYNILASYFFVKIAKSQSNYIFYLKNQFSIWLGSGLFEPLSNTGLWTFVAFIIFFNNRFNDVLYYTFPELCPGQALGFSLFSNKTWGLSGTGVFILWSCDTLHTHVNSHLTKYVTSD